MVMTKREQGELWSRVRAAYKKNPAEVKAKIEAIVDEVMGKYLDRFQSLAERHYVLQQLLKGPGADKSW